MTASGTSPNNKQSKDSGCSILIKAGMVILGFVVLLQVMDAISDFFGYTTTLCCIGLILIVVFIVFVLRGSGKDDVTEPEDSQAEDPWVPLDEGKYLLSQGNREQAVAAYLQAYREGSPAVRDLAIKALDELGEVETF